MLQSLSCISSNALVPIDDKIAMGCKGSKITICSTADTGEQQEEVSLQLNQQFLRSFELYKDKDGSFNIQRIVDNTKMTKTGVRFIKTLAEFRKVEGTRRTDDLPVPTPTPSGNQSTASSVITRSEDGSGPSQGMMMDRPMTMMMNRPMTLPRGYLTDSDDEEDIETIDLNDYTSGPSCTKKPDPPEVESDQSEIESVQSDSDLEIIDIAEDIVPPTPPESPVENAENACARRRRRSKAARVKVATDESMFNLIIKCSPFPLI